MKNHSNRNRRTLGVVTVLGGVAALVSACTPPVGNTRPTVVRIDRTLPVNSEKVSLNPEEFSTKITNRYWLMKPDTQRTS